MMIDLHNHVLPEVDDGADSMDTTLAMLQMAIENGIRAVVATPHLLNGLNDELLILTQYRKVCKAVIDAKLNIDVFLGSEINFQFGLEEILESCIGTYRGMGRYFLLETNMNHYPTQLEGNIRKVISNGITPIFAHPERIGPLIGKTEKIKELVRIGLLMQVNSGSLLGIFGMDSRDFAWELLEKRLVTFIASDAHTVRKRSFNLKQVWDAVAEKYNEETAEELLYTNPLKVIFGEYIKPRIAL